MPNANGQEKAQVVSDTLDDTTVKSDLDLSKVLFVDDEPAMLKAMKRFSRGKHWQLYVASSGQEGLDLIKSEPIDVIISDMRMPEMNGYEFLTQARALAPSSSRILLTGYTDIESLGKTINEAGLHNYIPKPWDDTLLHDVISGALDHQIQLKEKTRLEALTKEQKKKLGILALTLDRQIKEKTIELEQAMTLLQCSHNQLQRNFHDTLESLTRIIESKEGGSEGHSRFVAKYAEKLAKCECLTSSQIENVRVAGLLHRVGMIALPDDIRTKPIYSLNKEERVIFYQYPVWSEMVLSNAPGLHEVAKIIRHVHEYINGNGVPDKLCHTEIPVESKIIAIASDFYDVFNGQLDRNLKGFEDAKKYLQEWSSKIYDASLTQKFIELSSHIEIDDPSVFIVKSKDIEEGLVLAKDVVLDNGIMLLSAGSLLCKKAIDCIKSYENNLNIKIDLHVSKTENSK